MAGDIIGSVMVKMVRYLLAPRVTEASSKGGIHRVEESRQHEEHKRRGAEGGVEDQAGPAVEIDNRPLDAEPGFCELVG